METEDFSLNADIFSLTFEILATVRTREHAHTFCKCQHALLVEYAVLNPACDLRVE